MPKITEVDKNFKNKAVFREDMKLYSVKDKPFRLYGFYEPYKRIPTEVARNTNDGVLTLHTHTAGGRVRFKTDSEYIAIKVILPDVWLMPHIALTGSCGFDCYTDGVYYGTFVPPIEYKDFKPGLNIDGGYESILTFKTKKMRDIIINFPLYNGVTEVYIGLSESASVLEGDRYKHEKPIVYYGSSITQGGCASRPGNSYQSLISRWYDTDFINLGFSGNARAEDAMSDYISELDMSIFVYDYDHNAPNAEFLEKTHYNMYKKIRDKNPKLPIILASAPMKRDNEEWHHRYEIIKQTYDRAKKDGDENIYLVSGHDMVELFDPEIMTVDGCHPNDFGFFCMAKAFAGVIEKLL